MLFDGQAEDVENGMPLEKKANVNLNRYFLPNAPSKIAKDLWGMLPIPQPDRALGHVTRMDAQMSGAEVQVPFSEDEEQIADWMLISFNSILCSSQQHELPTSPLLMSQESPLHLR